jgi:hypothetical protein
MNLLQINVLRKKAAQFPEGLLYGIRELFRPMNAHICGY